MGKALGMCTILGLAIAITVTMAVAEAGEIAKMGMKVTASGTSYGLVTDAINGSTGGHGWLSPGAPAWIQFDMGRRYMLDSFRYQPRIASDAVGRIKDYELYATDDPANWGDVVATGTWPNDDVPKDIAVGVACRFVILKGLNVQTADGRVGCAEAYFFGTPVTSITAFELKDPTTNSTKFMNASTVNVSQFVIDLQGDTVSDYLITDDATFPAVDDPRWPGTGVQPATHTISGDAPATDGRQVTVCGWAKTGSGVMLCSTPTIVCLITMPAAEVPKDQMAASASKVGHASASQVIDNSLGGTNGWFATSGPGPAWLQLDLGVRYSVAYFKYVGRTDGSEGIRDYDIYITDTGSDPSKWGDPIASGSFENHPYIQEVPLTVGSGRYLVLNAKTGQPSGGWICATEVWVYGTRAATVTGFAVADQTSGSTVVVNTAGVNVTTFTADTGSDTVAAYAITEDLAVPDAVDARWQDTKPAAYAILGDAPATPGRFVTLQGWIKTDGGQIVASTPVTFYYTSYVMTEISKTPMVATASSMTYNSIRSAIDGANRCWLTKGFTLPQWLCVDMGSRYTIGYLRYLGRYEDTAGRTKDYDIFITDDATDVDTWGEPVLTGTFPNSNQVQGISPTIKAGRYLIVSCNSSWSADQQVSVGELWFYGQPAPNLQFSVADGTTGSTMFVNSSPANVTITPEPLDQTFTNYVISESLDVPAADDVRWALNTTPPANLAIPGDPVQPAVRLVTLRAWAKAAGGEVIGSAPVTICYTSLPLTEIPKSQMAATASNTNAGSPASLLNGNLGDYWVSATSTSNPVYVQFNLGGRYVVGHFRFLNRTDDAPWRSRSYNVYVTDTPGERVDAVASGVVTTNEQPQDIVLTPKVGRYLIVELPDYWTQDGAGAAEVWIYGSPAAAVTGFQVADADSGSTLFINSATVNVKTFTVDPAGDEITHYMITEGGEVPPAGDLRWAEGEPITYAITGDPPTVPGRDVTLQGWIKTASGQIVGSVPQTVYYTSLVMAPLAKGQMKASASSVTFGTAHSAINGVAAGDDMWYTAIAYAPAWLQLDLGGRFTIGYATLVDRVSGPEGRTKDFDMYVTDDAATWGDPVYSGSLANTEQPQNFLPTMKTGRYVIINCKTTWNGNISLAEVTLFGGPAADVSFSVADAATGSAKFINEPSVQVTNLTIVGEETVTKWMVSESTAVPSADDLAWQTDVPATCTITGAEPAAMGRFVTLRGWAMLDTGEIVGSAPITVVYTTLAGAAVPKSQMTPSASTALFGSLAGTINGNVTDEGWISWPQPQWFQLDLGGRYIVNMFSYVSRWADRGGRTKDYEIYVTDNPAAWGTPVAAGTFAVGIEGVAQDVLLPPKAGRYLIMNGLTGWDGNMIGVTEAYVYGSPAATVTAFQVADIATGSTKFIHSPTVAVNQFTVDDGGDAVVGYLIAPQGDTPAEGDGRWQPEVPVFYTIDPAPADSTFVSLVGWAKTATGQIVPSAPQRLFYTTLPLAEIPKSQMTAMESTATDWCMGKLAINGSASDTGWLTNVIPGWLQIDMGRRYTVGMFAFQTSLSNPEAAPKNYNLYVTDNPAVWGTPVLTGTLPGTPAPVEVPMPAKAGRYFIFEVLDSYNSRIGAGEIWLYGQPAVDTSFAVADQLSGSAKFITSLTVNVTDFTPDPQGETVTHYAITENNDIPATGDARWTATAPATCNITSAPALGTHVLVQGWVKTESGKIAGSKPIKLYYSALALAEIPKNTIAVTASSSTDGAEPGDVLDGGFNWPQAWITKNAAPQWLMLDLGEASACTVGYLTYVPRQDNCDGWTKDVDIYVTNDPGNWGTAVASVTFAQNSALKDIPLPATAGRFVILNCKSFWSNYLGIAELYVYAWSASPGAKPAVASFTAADQSTGSQLFTNSATVNVSITAVQAAPDAPIAGYLVTQTPDEPLAGDAGWKAAPEPYAITGGPGTITLYAWAKDTADTVSDSKSATIYFNTAAAAVSNVTVTTVTPGTAVTIAWNTDIPAEGGLNYGPAKMDGSTPSTAPEGALGTGHSVTVSGLTNGTNYKFVLVNNERLSTEILPAPGIIIYWPNIWPIQCDVNRDCKVNILDLISIRNKLNQPVTGDNVYADVNLPVPDGKINILDLIAVRNKLNTACAP